METYTEETLPDDARYLGTEKNDGSVPDWLDDAISAAVNPARVRHEDGIHSFFDLGE
jgi:hypothetical protein